MIEQNQLKAVAGQGPEAVADFLKKQATERKEQVQSAEEALALMRKELGSLDDAAKKAIIEGSRRVIQGALDTVVEDIRTAAQDKLADLKAEQRKTLDAKNAALAEQQKIATIPEYAYNEGRELTNEVTQAYKAGDYKTLGLYAAVVAGTGLAAKWVWDHTLGWALKKVKNIISPNSKDKKPGIIAKSLSWIAALGGAALAAVGLRKSVGGGSLLAAGEQIFEAGKGVIEGVSKGVKDITDATKKAIEGLPQGKNIEEFFKRNEAGEFKTPKEYVFAFAEAAMKDGWDFVINTDGSIFIAAGKKIVSLQTNLWSPLLEWFQTGELKTGEIIAAYVNGAIVYGTSLAAIKAVTFGRYAKGSGLLKETALWPYYIIKRPVGAVAGTISFAHEVVSPNGTVRTSILRRYNTAKQWKLYLGSFFDVSPEGLAVRHQAVKDLMDLCERVPDHPNINAFKAARDDAVTAFKKYLHALDKKGQVPQWMRDAIQSEMKTTVDIGRLGESQLLPILKKSQAPGAAAADVVEEAAAVTKAPAVPPPIPRKTPPPLPQSKATPPKLPEGGSAVEGRIAQGTEMAAESVIRNRCARLGLGDPSVVEKVLEEAPLRRLITNLPEEGIAKIAGKNLSEMRGIADAFSDARGTLPAALLEPQVLRVVEQNPTFVRQLTASEPAVRLVEKQAAQGAKVAEQIASASKLARVGNALKFAGKTVPLAIDAFAIYATTIEMLETKEHIAKLRAEGKVSEDVIKLEEQRYLYQAAQIGVSGVGALAGIGLVAGVAGSGPVALATLPVSAVIYGAYEGHKWEEDKTRSVEDWKNEYDLITLLTDVRTYSFGHRVGHTWELANPNGFDIFLPPMVLLPKDIYRAVSGQTAKDAASLMEKIKGVDEKKIRAIVEHTTSVTLPTQVKGADGKPRDLTPEEVQEFKDSLKRYVDAKVEFFLKTREDATHPIRSNGDITDLLENSEYAGLLAKDKPAIEKEVAELKGKTDNASKERAAALEAVLKETNSTKQAELYGDILKKDQTDTLFTAIANELATKKESERETARAPLIKSLAQSIVGANQHAYVNFCVQCEEANLKDYWLDGDSQRVARLYAQERMGEIAEERAAAIVKTMIDQADSVKDRSLFEFREAIQKAQTDIERFLANPKGVYENMPKETKGRLGYKFSGEGAEKLPDNLKKRVKAGELLMSHVNANYNGTYYTKQFGWIGNKFLYMTFDKEQGKWLAGLWSIDNVKDPASFTVDMWGGSSKYNQLLEDLAAINEDKEPSQ